MTKVLVVDDDRSVRELVAMNLKLSGYEVSTAVDGAAAIDIIRHERPDVVLLDVMMPEVDGRTVARTVRNDPDLRDIGIVFVTACGSDPDVWTGWRTGADPYLCKPFEPTRMIDEIDRIVRTGRTTSTATTDGDRVVVPDVDPSAFADWFVGRSRVPVGDPKMAGASL